MDAKVSREQELIREEKRFKENAEKAKKWKNWGYTTMPEEIEFPNGTKLKVEKLPSGACYVRQNGALVRITPQWIHQQQRLLKAQYDKEQADKDNGINGEKNKYGDNSESI